LKKIIVPNLVTYLLKALNIPVDCTVELIRLCSGKHLYEVASYLLKFRKPRALMAQSRLDIHRMGFGLWLTYVLREAYGDGIPQQLKALFGISRSLEELEVVSEIVESAKPWEMLLAEPFSECQTYKPTRADLSFLPLYYYPRFQTPDGVTGVKMSGLVSLRETFGGAPRSSVGFFSTVTLEGISREIVMKAARRRVFFNLKTVNVFSVGKLDRLGTRRGSPITRGDLVEGGHEFDALMAVPFVSGPLVNKIFSSEKFPVYAPDLAWGPISIVCEREKDVLVVTSDLPHPFTQLAGVRSPESTFAWVNEVPYIPIATLVRPAFDPKQFEKLPKYSLVFFQSVSVKKSLVLRPSVSDIDPPKNEALIGIPFEVVETEEVVEVLFPSLSSSRSLLGKSALDVLRIPCEFAEDVREKIMRRVWQGRSDEYGLLWLEPVGTLFTEEGFGFPRWGVYLTTTPTDFTGGSSIYTKYSRDEVAKKYRKLEEIRASLRHDLAV